MKNNLHIVYKIVRPVTDGLFVSLMSLLFGKEWTLEYRIGSITKAKEPSLIFCFGSDYNAIDYAKSVGVRSFILECETNEVPQLLTHRTACTNIAISVFWKKESRGVMTPTGTLGVTQLKPIRIVYEHSL